MVSDEGLAKIIDFWFGKKIETSIDNNKSISLNWRYAPPDEFTEWQYTISTDIYFLGKLFEEIIKKDPDLYNFQYTELLKKMVKPSPSDRYNRFIEVQNDILSLEGDDNGFEVSFSDEDKSDYRGFAWELLHSLSKISNDITYVTDIEEIQKKLSDIYKNSMLEDVVYDMVWLINVFIKWEWTYYSKRQMFTSTLGSFLKLLKSHSKDEQKIILDHLRIRISGIDRIKNPDEISIEDIPF